MKLEVTKEQYKINLINLAESHKKECDGDCGVSLILLLQFAEESGLKFTKKEKEIFG